MLEPRVLEVDDIANGLLVVGVLVEPAQGHPASAGAMPAPQHLPAACVPSTKGVGVYQLVFSFVARSSRFCSKSSRICA